MTAPSVPPISPHLTGPGGIAPAKPAPLSPALALVQAAPVRAVPEKISEPRTPKNTAAQTTGRVQPRENNDHTLRVRTPEGDIEIETDADIPAGENVDIEIYQKDGKTVADLRLARAQTLAETPPAPPQTATAPAPPLKIGDKVTAMILPEEAPTAPPADRPAAQTALPPDLARVADALQQLKNAGLQNLASQLPISPQLQEEILNSTDIGETLQKMPLIDQERLKDFFNRPAVQQAMAALLPPRGDTLSSKPPSTLPQALAAYTNAAPQTPPSNTLSPALDPSLQSPLAQASSQTLPSEEKLIDNNLLNIVKAQISASLTHDALRDQGSIKGAPVDGQLRPSPLTSSALGQIKTILPLIENIDSLTTPTSAILRQLAPGMMQAQAVAQDALADKFRTLDIRAIFPPGQSPPASDTQGLVKGVVQMVTPAGYPIIAAGDKHMILKSPATIAQGSTVFFSATPVTLEQLFASAQAPTLDIDGFLPLFSKEWPSLQAVLQAAQQALAPDQAQALTQTMPAPTARMVPATLFFLAALRMGSVESWLGPSVMGGLDAAGKRDLLQRLRGDFGKIADQAKETLPGEWRAISMPLLHGGQINQIQFFVRRQHDENNNENPRENRATRFILNLALSRMGDMQLDGLIKKKNFDLILRSNDALPAGIRDALRQAFAAGLAQTGIDGGLTFQRRAQSWVQIDLPHHPETLI